MKYIPPNPSNIFTVSLKGKAVRLLLFLVILALTVAIFVYRDQLEGLYQYGYAGVFIVNLMASGTVLIPAPGILFTYAIAAVLNPLWVAIASATGATLGELSGYGAGVSGQAVIGNTKLYQKLYDLMQNHTKLTNIILLVAATIPNPFFDLVGMAAGALRLPVLRFLCITYIGNTIKMIAVAYAGYYSLSWLTLH
jgi:membrane protein YqaA with SNARE-associated domain